MQKNINSFSLFIQYGGVITEYDKIINVTKIVSNFQCVFNELIKFVQIHIGKKLASQASNWKPFSIFCMKKRFMRRNLLQQIFSPAKQGSRMYGILLQDSGSYVIKILSSDDWVGQFRECCAPHFQSDCSINAREKSAYIHFAIPFIFRFAQEFLQSCNRSLRSFSLAVGITIIDKSFVKPRFNMSNEPLMDKPVFKGGGKYFSKLGIGHCKDSKWFGFISFFDDCTCLLKYQMRHMNKPGSFVFAVSGFGRTGEKQFYDVSFCQGI